MVTFLALIWATAGTCPAQAGPEGAGTVGAGTEAITRPSEDRTLSFVAPGLIAKMAIEDEKAGKVLQPVLKLGDAVRTGQVLARQDTQVEQAQAEQLKAKAEDQIRIEAQDAKLKQTEVDLRKFEEAKTRGGATQLEVEHARLEVTIAKLSLRLANFEQLMAKRAYEQKVLQIARMAIRSPVDGVVEEIFLRTGQSANALEKVIRVVKIDPLWIDVPVPRDQASGLAKGQAARVDFDPPRGGSAAKPSERRIVEGKIIHIAAVADAGSITRTVRVEVPNQFNRPAGEHVKVEFPPTNEKPKKTAAK